jgi:hypothetical protein
LLLQIIFELKHFFQHFAALMTTKRGLPDKPQTEGHLVSGSDGLSFDAAVEHYIDPAAEKRLIVKLDLYLAPVMTLIFLAAYLDRANIGNAASAGMTADLHMTSGQLGSKYPDRS